MKRFAMIVAIAATLLVIIGAATRLDPVAWGLRAFAAGDPTVAALALPARLHQDLNVLVVGSDARPGASVAGKFGRLSERRADAIVVFTVGADGLRALAVPRDLRIETDAHGPLALASLLEYGGAAGLIAAVSNEVTLPIHHYVEIDIAGLAAVVDELGGVPFTTRTSLRDTKIGLEMGKGSHVLTGPEFVALVRSRQLEAKENDEWYPQGSGDLDRVARRNDLMASLSTEWSGADPATLVELVDRVRKHATTDRTLSTWSLGRLALRFAAVGTESIKWTTLPVQELRTVEDRRSPFSPDHLGAGYWLVRNVEE